jgi:CBS-domain-containing membrane protein
MPPDRPASSHAGSDPTSRAPTAGERASGVPADAAPNATTASPIRNAPREVRRRLGWRGELALAALPTVTVLVVLLLVETLARQRLLYASLASSAFLIYLDPTHPTNHVRTLLVAQAAAAALGWAALAALGPGYAAGATAMVTAIVAMIAADAVHPPAVSTALSFALGTGDTRPLVLFGLALLVTAGLVLLQHVAVRMLARLARADWHRAAAHLGAGRAARSGEPPGG